MLITDTKVDTDFDTTDTIINNFRGMALWGEPSKEVLYWGGHNLVNFPSLAPPLKLCVCTYLVLSNWRFGLCVQMLYSFC